MNTMVGQPMFRQIASALAVAAAVSVFATSARAADNVTVTVNATVSEVIYAGAITRIAAIAAPGVTLTATILTASTSLPPDLHHGTQITLAWPEKAVHQLKSEE